MGHMVKEEIEKKSLDFSHLRLSCLQDLKKRL